MYTDWKREKQLYRHRKLCSKIVAELYLQSISRLFLFTCNACRICICFYFFYSLCLCTTRADGMKSRQKIDKTPQKHKMEILKIVFFFYMKFKAMWQSVSIIQVCSRVCYLIWSVSFYILVFSYFCFDFHLLRLLSSFSFVYNANQLYRIALLLLNSLFLM